MSSFKRKAASRQTVLRPGTRTSPSSSSTTIISTGIPSLDDILGGGLPLSCSLLIATPDLHSSYGELVQKYFIAQGLACGQRLCVIDNNAKDFVGDIMWLPGVVSGASTSSALIEGDEDEKMSQGDDQKIKIAWRYGQMKQFQTTVASSSPSTEDYCQTFDLTSRVPDSVVNNALDSGQITLLAIESSNSNESSTAWVLRRVAEVIKPEDTMATSSPLRICIPSLASPQWGDLTSQEILYFLYSLRSLLRRHPDACASISLPPHLSTDNWGGPGWIQKLGWLSDAAVTLSAFTANPSLSAIFPSYHGLLYIHTLPSPHTLLPPSDKFSTLRGLSSSAVSIGGSGENNLAFKCTRKRLIFETLHLDLEGGVGERRTTASTNALAGITHDPNHRSHSHEEPRASKTARAAVEVQFEGLELEKRSGTESAVVESKPKKPKKKVAFRSDRPDLYDF